MTQGEMIHIFVEFEEWLAEESVDQKNDNEASFENLVWWITTQSE